MAEPEEDFVSPEVFADIMGQMGVMIATGDLERTGERTEADGRRVVTYTVTERPQPHTPPGQGSGKTRRRNARRRRQRETNVDAIIMHDAAWAALPDRTALTGMPLVGQDYRDSTRPDCIFRWVGDGFDHRRGKWAVFTRKAPLRSGAHLRGAGFSFVSHQQMADGGYVYIYANQADPRLFVRVAREHADAEQRVTLVVGAKGFDLDDWDAAAEALAALEGGDDA